MKRTELKRTSTLRSKSKLRYRAKAKSAEAYIVIGEREICQPNSAGDAEYRRRTLAMRERQGELCALCGLWMSEEESTFDHFAGRTAGRRDDRIMIGTERINGAVHARCNAERGSRRTKYLLQ